MTEAKKAHILTSYYCKLYADRYNSKAVVNRNKARWSFAAMMNDLTETEIKSLLDYYFETISANAHQLEWFFFNYDKLIEGKRIKDEDVSSLNRLREQSEKRAREWRKKIGGD